MQNLSGRAVWRKSFIGGLRRLTQACSRLPFGVPDPVLSGSSAVELYTGGLWSSPDLEVLSAHPRLLTAELFAAGFRWCERSGQGPRSLWHPDLEIGLEIVEQRSALDAAALANRLVVAINLPPWCSGDAGARSLKIVGIEDLITQQVNDWLGSGARSGEFGIKLQALVGLAREGVGGPLRGGYLQRRVAWESGGQVVLELPFSDEGLETGDMAREMTLIRMRELISNWSSRNGLISEDPETKQTGVPEFRREVPGIGARYLMEKRG